MSRGTLERFLSRSVTHAGLCHTERERSTRRLEEDIRMLTSAGAKFVGRASLAWTPPRNDEAHFRAVERSAAKALEADPEIILQACVFEIVTVDAARIPVPAWVFREFGLKPEKRSFQYEAMLYENGHLVDSWSPGASVPDMSRLETRMWFYYRARRYIDCGHEAIHFGQVMIMDDADPGHRGWLDMLGRVRSYARKNARRRFVLCDAHTHGEVENGRLLFDFHSFPMRAKEIVAEARGEEDSVERAEFVMGHIDSPFGRSKGGVAPSGWRCKSLPYLAEVDNFGRSDLAGRPTGTWWLWGYDEISWFARQPETYRNNWLIYAWNWIRENDPNGFFQMPARRGIASPKDDRRVYRANRRSRACPQGFGQEDTIRAIWAADAKSRRLTPEGAP